MHPKSETTVLTLANATALVTAVLRQVSGHEVANTLGGTPLTQSAMSKFVCSRIHAKLSKYTSQGVAK